jgi:hypothetical protein
MLENQHGLLPCDKHAVIFPHEYFGPVQSNHHEMPGESVQKARRATENEVRFTQDLIQQPCSFHNCKTLITFAIGSIERHVEPNNQTTSFFLELSGVILFFPHFVSRLGSPLRVSNRLFRYQSDLTTHLSHRKMANVATDGPIELQKVCACASDDRIGHVSNRFDHGPDASLSDERVRI